MQNLRVADTGDYKSWEVAVVEGCNTWMLQELWVAYAELQELEVADAKRCSSWRLQKLEITVGKWGLQKLRVAGAGDCKNCRTLGLKNLKTIGTEELQKLGVAGSAAEGGVD